MRDKARWFVMSCHSSGQDMIHYVKSEAGPIIAQCGSGNEANRNAAQIVKEHNAVLDIEKHKLVLPSPWDEEWDELLEGVEVDEEGREEDDRNPPGYNGDTLC